MTTARLLNGMKGMKKIKLGVHERQKEQNSLHQACLENNLAYIFDFVCKIIHFWLCMKTICFV